MASCDGGNQRKNSAPKAMEVIEDAVVEFAEQKKNDGNQLYKEKRYEDALRCYSEAIDLMPENVAFLGNRCACLMMLSKFQLAIEDAQKCVKLDANFVKGYVREAKCHVVLGDLTSAYRCFEHIKRLDPSNRDLALESENVKLIEKYIQEYEKSLAKNDHRAALFYSNKALEIATHCTKYKLYKAEAFVMLNRHQEAQDLLADIIRLDPLNADALCVRGISLYYQDNIDKAFTHFQQSLRLSPEHEKAREVYKKAKLLKTKKEEGNAAVTNNNPQEAVDIYTFALTIDPKNNVTNAKLYFNRAIALTKLKKLKEAVDDCSSAIKLDEHYLKAYLKRAKLYSDLEMYEECVRDYEKVTQKDRSREYRNLLDNAKLQLKRSKRKDYYKILGLQKNATDDEIKKAYRKRAMLHHPDRHSDASEEVRREEERKFKELGEAYSVLTDSKKRARYDNGLDIDGSGGAGFDFEPNLFNNFFGQGVPTAGFTFSHFHGYGPSNSGFNPFGQFQ